MRVALRSVVASAFFTCVLSSFATAAWVPNGTPVLGIDPSRADYTLLAPDEAGGVLVASRIAYNVGRTNGSRFTADGELSATFALPPQSSLEHAGVATAALVPDGAGGVFVFSYRTGPLVPHLFVDGVQLVVARMTASGEVARGWPAEGVVIDSTWTHWQALAEPMLSAVTTRDGGVVVGWLARDATANAATSIRAQSIGRDGELRWGAGPRVLDGVHTFVPPAIASDGAGGALVFWGTDSIAGHPGGAFGQHVDAGGRPLWGESGVRLSRPEVTRVYEVFAVADGRGGATVAWLGGSWEGRRVYAAHVNRGRRRGPIPDLLLGDPVRSADGTTMAPTDHSAIVAWCEVTPEGIRRVKAQRLDEHGRPQWPSRGVLVCSIASNKKFLRAVSDGRDGAYLAWADDRQTGEIQAARITPSGRLARGWSIEGTPVCAAMPDTVYGAGRFADVESMEMTAGRGGTAYLTWVDTRMIVRDGYAAGDPEQGFVMKLEINGPAARPAYPTEPVATRPAAPSLAGDPAASRAPAFALRGAQPNPVAGAASIAFALPSNEPAQLELFDVAGRRVWSRDVGTFGAGEHRVPIADGDRLPPGLYLVRLRDARHRATSRMVVTR